MRKADSVRSGLKPSCDVDWLNTHSILIASMCIQCGRNQYTSNVHSMSSVDRPLVLVREVCHAHVLVHKGYPNQHNQQAAQTTMPLVTGVRRRGARQGAGIGAGADAMVVGSLMIRLQFKIVSNTMAKPKD